MSDLISRESILKKIEKIRQSLQMMDDTHRASITMNGMYLCEKAVRNQLSAQLQYEEITPEEAASEIASGSIMSAHYWLDAMIRLKQMGYAICRKR